LAKCSGASAVNIAKIKKSPDGRRGLFLFSRKILVALKAGVRRLW
jgi:hypothetical protein